MQLVKSQLDNTKLNGGKEIMKEMSDEEELEESIIKALKISEQEIERGEVIDIDVALKELREKFGYYKS